MYTIIKKMRISLRIEFVGVQRKNGELRVSSVPGSLERDTSLLAEKAEGSADEETGNVQSDT